MKKVTGKKLKYQYTPQTQLGFYFVYSTQYTKQHHTHISQNHAHVKKKDVV